MDDPQLKALKTRVITACREQLSTKCSSYRERLDSLRDSLESESKSTAGDKHETGRAMVQLEMERASSRWKKAEEELQYFERVAYGKERPSERVGPGSLVQTNKGFYFVAVSLGMITVDGIALAVVSASAPVGAALMGKQVGEEFRFNGMAQSVQAVI